MKRIKTKVLRFAIAAAFVFTSLTSLEAANAPKIFNVLQFGAVGDGITVDTPAIQRAIDAAAQAGDAQALVPRGHRYLIGTLELRGGIDFHLDGELVISTNPADYRGDGVITALNAGHLRITGTGKINGRSLEFMTVYETTNEWWLFK